MATTYIRTFDEPQACDPRLVGGKGANLGALSGEGFRVPPGFCVTTHAYAAFLKEGNVSEKLEQVIAGFDYGADRLEVQTEQIRNLITGSDMPRSVISQIEQAYKKLGDNPYVAVRSSGTAEDLAEASFAGLHDTYLNVKGVESVVDAVKRCWASMWSSRATAYRYNKGFNHSEAQLAVVVQAMISSDVSGVMFTVNPMTTATDEIAINASWGLGEAIVSGIVNPDTFIVRSNSLAIKERLLGDKELQIRRADGGMGGNVEEEVSAAQRSVYCMTDSQVQTLASLGLRIQTFYEGFPQDIEWALAGGEFYVLQSRPVTGVEFSWDADLENGNELPDDPSTTWTRALADEVTTGVVTPLQYSLRYGGIYNNDNWPHWARLMGLPEMAKLRAYKYYKAEVYYNCELERMWVLATTWPAFRRNRVYWLPESWHKEVIEAPFSIAAYIKTYARLHLLAPNVRWNSIFKILQDWRTHRAHEARGLSSEELRQLSNSDLVSYCEHQSALESEWNTTLTPAFLLYYPELMNLFAVMVGKWYDGGNSNAYAELISGSNEPTDTTIQNLRLSGFAEEIRNSPELTALFKAHENGAFFKALEGSEEGRAFLARYKEFLHDAGHRGHSDRDIWYPRRVEDPSLDYQAFRLMLSGPPIDHKEMERVVNARRAETFKTVLANIQSKPFGVFKAKLFKLTYNLVHRYLIARDNERSNPGDVIMFSYKRGYSEIARRMVERGDLEDEIDVFYLSRWELYSWFEGTEKNVKLLKAKIAARKRDVLRFHRREVEMPMYMREGKVIDLSLDSGSGAAEGELKGLGTSPGTVTGTARIVRSLAEIGRVNHGEILVVHATDPGWTPVFLIIKGVVVETGGIMAHASCLAREYGFPAVHLKKAMKLIPDGATIEINGAAGLVKILDDGSDMGNGNHRQPQAVQEQMGVA